jgi:hypothetical protein
MSLKMTLNAFLVGSLETGELVGWDLTSNAVVNFQAHNSAISILDKHESFLLSGDVQGNV